MTWGERVIAAIAKLLIPSDDREVVLGDVFELRLARLARIGPLRATVRALVDVVASARACRTRRGAAQQHPSPTWTRRAPLADMGRDLRLAVRGVVREPAFTLVMVLTIGIGVGAVASVFGMANQLLLRPLPGVTDTQGTAYLRFLSREAPDAWNGLGLAMTDFDALRSGADFASALASYGNATLQVARGAERPRRVWGNTVYGDFFEALGVRPAEGRLLTAGDVAFGADPLVAVISERLRGELFAPDESAVGSTLVVNGVHVRVLGVAGRGFQGLERRSDADMWVPHTALVPLVGFTEERLLDRNSTMHHEIVVRLRPEWSPARATERIQALLDGLGAAVPEQAEYLGGLEPTFFPGLTARPGARESIRRSLAMLGVIVSMVLLLACANAANLLLFRNVTRRGRAAVRRALGASPAHVARGELLHSLVLATLGSACGLAVACLISFSLRGESLVGAEIEPLAFDGRVLAFGVAISILTAVLFGAAPAVLAGRVDLRGGLQASGRGDTGRVARMRSAMASGQVALTLALLVTGVMLVRTVGNLYALDTGVRVDGLAVLPLEFPRDYDDEAIQVASEEAVRVVERLPAIERASISLYDPLGSARMMGRIALPSADDGEISTEMLPVSASWFEVVEMDAADGTPLRPGADGWLEGTVILSKGLAARLFGTPEVAIGRRVRHRFGGTPTESRVVAVTRDLRTPHEPDTPRETLFVPIDQGFRPATYMVLRATTLDRATLTAIRSAIEAVLPDAPVADPEPLSSYLDRIHAEERVFGLLLALLSGSAVLLAAVGLYGVVAFSVAGRRRELGVRIAVGAGPGRIVGLIVQYAGSIVFVGSLLGVAGGYALSRVMESRLYGVDPTDLQSYAAAVLAFAVTAGLACLAPTRRAIRVDPVTALRSE